MIHYSVSLYSVKINSATGRQLFLDKPYAILDLMEREVHNAGDLLIIISRQIKAGNFRKGFTWFILEKAGICLFATCKK